MCEGKTWITNIRNNMLMDLHKLQQYLPEITLEPLSVLNHAPAILALTRCPLQHWAFHTEWTQYMCTTCIWQPHDIRPAWVSSSICHLPSHVTI